jgi:hypothetical protein
MWRTSCPTVCAAAPADKWLVSLLSADPVNVCDIETQAEAQGIAKGTMERAKARLGIEAIPKGKGWAWQLQGRQAPAASAPVPVAVIDLQPELPQLAPPSASPNGTGAQPVCEVTSGAGHPVVGRTEAVEEAVVPRGGLRPGAGRPKGSKDRTNVADAPRQSNAHKSNGQIKESKVHEPQTIDGATGLVGLDMQTIPLSTLRHIRVEMAWVYRAVDCGKLDIGDGSQRQYMLRHLAELITAAEFEDRLEQLEKQREELVQDGQGALPVTYEGV